MIEKEFGNVTFEDDNRSLVVYLETTDNIGHPNLDILAPRIYGRCGIVKRDFKGAVVLDSFQRCIHWKACCQYLRKKHPR